MLLAILGLPLYWGIDPVGSTSRSAASKLAVQGFHEIHPVPKAEVERRKDAATKAKNLALAIDIIFETNQAFALLKENSRVFRSSIPERHIDRVVIVECPASGRVGSITIHFRSSISYSDYTAFLRTVSDVHGTPKVSGGESILMRWENQRREVVALAQQSKNLKRLTVYGAQSDWKCAQEYWLGPGKMLVE